MFLDLKPKRGVSITVPAIPFPAAHSCPSTTVVDLGKTMRIKMKLKTTKTSKKKIQRKIKGKVKRDRDMEMKMTRGYPCV